MTSTNSPEKSDPKFPSAFVITSTHSRNVNLNVVLNRLNQPPSLSSDSDLEVIPPDKVIPKPTHSKKLNSVISFPHQFPGLSNHLVQSDKRIYSIVPTDSRVVKKIDYSEILNLKLVKANLERTRYKRRSTTRFEIRTHGPRTSLPDWGNFTLNITTILLCAKIACGWMAGWQYRRICLQQC